MKNGVICILVCMLILLNIFTGQIATGSLQLCPPTPPQQPPTGPGGSSYSYAGVIIHRYGVSVLQYWIFEPTDPKPATAPLIVFNHGWGAMVPFWYQTWINHIVKRGNIVVYPRYQQWWLPILSRYQIVPPPR